ncbi:sporulation histidine kinase inhibitor Sda [Paenibacillus albidus]|uniref:sporulation histidine kinase inhibitor Sda n=1 Tax=Paenibacillus albidus TaxID=2041023 RepID=UPI001BE9B278|nr:sporulation histidine kinase inhibitor Sda [Paenibacillus albidus]MBT2290709.1 sporulation histidine kinase inhibitor Sda [Paenibacillus albidus]
MNYQFHPSPRPSSLELLSNEQLLNIYEMAVEVKASPDFIEIIKNVMSGRNLIETDKPD